MKVPRRNRVSPTGDIEAARYRGNLMGNRGDLHGPDGSIVKQWASRRWISCVLHNHDGWRAPIDTPGRYYPLFFWDEAVALAAGHRPCGECRSSALSNFIQAWKTALGYRSNTYLPLPDIDAALHCSRLAERRSRAIATAKNLPDGTYVRRHTHLCPWLISEGAFWEWRPQAAGDVETINNTEMVEVLTPSPLIAVLRAGYPLLQRVPHMPQKQTR